MKRRLSFIEGVFGALLILGLSPAFAATLIEANFDVDPNVEDPRWQHQLAWDFYIADAGGLSGGIASYNTIDANDNASIITGPGSLPTAVSMTARMRVLDDDGFGGGGAAMILIQDAKMYIAGIVPSNTFQGAAFNAITSGITASHPMDTSVFHEYRIVITDITNGVYDLYADDILVLPNNLALDISPSHAFDGQVQFGDTQGQADADAELDWVRVEDASGPDVTVPVSPVQVPNAEWVEFEAIGRQKYSLEVATNLLSGVFMPTPGFVIGERGPLTMITPSWTNLDEQLHFRIVVDKP